MVHWSLNQEIVTGVTLFCLRLFAFKLGLAHDHWHVGWESCLLNRQIPQLVPHDQTRTFLNATESLDCFTLEEYEIIGSVVLLGNHIKAELEY